MLTQRTFISENLTPPIFRVPLKSTYHASDFLPELPLTLAGLRFDWLLDQDRNTFVELVAAEIGSRYPATGETYARDLLAAKSGNLAKFGASSIAKSIIACYKGSDLLGFTVATEKTNQIVKFGPSIVLPSARGHNVAVFLRLVAEAIYMSSGYIKAYSTCQAANLPARRYADKAGYRIEAILHDHYALGSTELVLAKTLSRRFAGQNNYCALKEDTTHSKSKPFRFVLKRGGAAKIHIDFEQLVVSPAYLKLDNLLEDILSVPDIKYARRVYLHIPFAASSLTNLRKFGFVPESAAIITSNEKDSEVIFGRNCI